MVGISRGPRKFGNKRELAELASACSLPRRLDLVHITSVGFGRRILTGAKMEATPCKVFGCDLVYFFLARPAYRFQDGDQKSHQLNRFPFIFVVSPEALPTPYHVYPFDTGAALAGVYGTTPDPTIPLDEYELAPTVDSAHNHVAWAFGEPSAYYDGTIKEGLAETLPEWRSVARGWIDIAGLASGARERPDARASAVEIAYKGPINLRQGHVKLVVLPQQLLEDSRGNNDELSNVIKTLGLATKTYNWRSNETPDAFMDEVTAIVKRHLQEDGQI